MLQELLAGVFGGFGEVLLLHFHLQNLMKERLQSGAGLLQGHARFEPAEDLDETAAAVVECIEAFVDLCLHHHRDAHLRRVSGLDAVEAFGG